MHFYYLWSRETNKEKLPFYDKHDVCKQCMHARVSQLAVRPHVCILYVHAWGLLNVCPEKTDANYQCATYARALCVNACPFGVRFRRLASILAGLLYRRDSSSVRNDNCVNWAVRGSCPLTSALCLFSLAGVWWLKKRETERKRGRTQLLVQGLHYPKAAYWFTQWDVSSLCLYWCRAQCICKAVSCDR